MSTVDNTDGAITPSRHRAAQPRSPDSAGLAVTQRRVIRSEWLKLRTVRSWMIMIGATAVLLIAFGALAASVASGAVTPQGPGGRRRGGGGRSAAPIRPRSAWPASPWRS